MQKDRLFEFFREHPGQDIGVEKLYLFGHRTVPMITESSVRALLVPLRREGKILKVQRAVYKLNPEWVEEAPSIEPELPPRQEAPQPETQSRDLVPLSAADLQYFGPDQEERFHDLRVARRLGYDQDRSIRKLIERRRCDLEKVGCLLLIAEPIHRGSASSEAISNLPPGYWLNFRQAILVAMWSETEEATATQIEIANIMDAIHKGTFRGGSDASIVHAMEAMVEQSKTMNAMMVEGFKQLGALVLRGAAQPASNVRPLRPEMFEGCIPGTTLRKLNGGFVTPTGVQRQLAEAMKAHTAAGGWTLDKQRKWLEHEGIVLGWRDDVVYEARKMLVPDASPGYEHWFGAYVSSRMIANGDAMSGPLQWQWCFTDAGLSGVLSMAPKARRFLCGGLDL